jgi:hypothetical protein
MLVSGWTELYQDMSHWSLTCLDLKMSRHSEKSRVVSFYGTRKTSSFQAWCHRHRVVAGHHHLRVHPVTTTTTTTRVHLDLHRRVSHRRHHLRPLSHRRHRLRPLSFRAKSGRVPPPQVHNHQEPDRSPSQKNLGQRSNTLQRSSIGLKAC